MPIGNGKGVGYWDGETGMGPAPGGEPSAGAGGDAMGNCDGTDAFFGLPDLCIEPR
ncbi:MAG: hypothetical protein FJ087_15550 [Deltaproteobacteria bacterium]|nr:hypothetical protein [Deltaproteobacteria bacterium]